MTASADCASCVVPLCLYDQPSLAELERYARERESRPDAETMIARAVEIPRLYPRHDDA